MTAGPEVARPRRAVVRAVRSGRRSWRLAPLRIRLLISTIGLLAAVCLVVGSISLLLLPPATVRMRPPSDADTIIMSPAASISAASPKKPKPSTWFSWSLPAL